MQIEVGLGSVGMPYKTMVREKRLSIRPGFLDVKDMINLHRHSLTHSMMVIRIFRWKLQKAVIVKN